jgi:ABC-type multidrug transport system ATPase subunit
VSPGLRFAKVGRRFGAQVALRDLELDCAPGAVTCFVGPNGAGKSTALALAAGLLAPTTGEVLFGDRPVRPGLAPKTTGYLPQRSAFHASFTVREVLDFTVAARSGTLGDLHQVLEVCGLDSVLGRSVGELSGGWLRRLGLLSAFLGSPSLLLLDEPFVGLDPETHDRLLDHLRQRLACGATLVMASHDFEVLDPFTPTVAVLEEGRLVCTATVSPGAARGPDSQATASPSSRLVYRRALGVEPATGQRENEA